MSTTSYDSLGEVYQSGDYLVAAGVAGTAQTTNYSYDADGNQAALTDPDGNTTSWQYDGLGQMTVQTSPIVINEVHVTDQYEYNAAGELTEKIDADGRAIVYGYLCPCQLAGADFFRVAVLFGPGTEKRVGGAGGGASSPCSPARGGRNRRTQQHSNGGGWQDALRTSPTLCA